LQANPHLLVLLAFLYIAQQRQDIQISVGQDDVAASVELQVESIQSIRELELKYAIGTDLGDRGNSTCLQVFAQLCDEARGRSGGCSRIVGKVAAEAGVDEQLFAVVGLVELDEEDALCMYE
jgi:hypothetical protein